MISLVYSPHHDRLVAFRNIFKVSQHHTIIKIPYLDQDADYVDQFGREFSGAELAYSGIHIPFAASDFQSYTLELSRT
ncbi:TPA: GH36 C-terminal domain-containing protein [Streptococcus suis]|nr:GH36 C-terminal domain-containing protein [Streptococcus suis]HEM5325412.1 GH36 C-terminal domain-containing protein [Streptococcus suis]